MIRIATATYEDLAYVASWLCAMDRFEMSHTRDPDNYTALADAAFASAVHKVACDEIEPVFAFGAYPIGDDAAHVWGFKTAKGPRAIRAVTRYLVRELIPGLRAAGIRRAQCYVHKDNLPSRRWLAHLGFWPEATSGEFGAPLILYQRDKSHAPILH